MTICFNVYWAFLCRESCKSKTKTKENSSKLFWNNASLSALCWGILRGETPDCISTVLEWFLSLFFSNLFFKTLFIYLFVCFLEREEKGRRKRGGETSVCGCPFHMPLTGDLALNPGMCPEWVLNRWSFGSQANTQSTEPHQSGLGMPYGLNSC